MAETLRMHFIFIISAKMVFHPTELTSVDGLFLGVSLMLLKSKGSIVERIAGVS